MLGAWLLYDHIMPLRVHVQTHKQADNPTYRHQEWQTDWQDKRTTQCVPKRSIIYNILLIFLIRVGKLFANIFGKSFLEILNNIKARKSLEIT